MNAPGPIPPIVHLPAAPDHFTPGRVSPPQWIALHNTQGTDSRAWLSRTSTPPASIHTLAMRGGILVEIVPPGATAWHLGVTRPGSGISNANSLGLELESLNAPGVAGNGYSTRQLASAAYRVATWAYSYGIDPATHLISHAAVAWPPGRRHDPWGLAWDPFRAQVAAWLAFWHSLNPADVARWIV